MADYTIKNRSKELVCETYEFTYGGDSPEHIGVVEYQDCNGEARTLTMTFEEADGRVFTLQICASSINSINTHIIDGGVIGECNTALP